MDKYNVIDITDDINKLELDYQNWCNLPFKMRLLSNDACQEKYGCNVYDLYLRLKSTILRYKDKEDLDNNNLTYTESIDYSEWEDYILLLQISKNIQSSPNIVILDPDIATIKELDEKYSSFIYLNDKFRIFSNDYSMQIWGYNVYQMYEKIKASLEEDDSDVDKDNAVRIETKYDAVIDPIYNEQVKASATCDTRIIESKLQIPCPDDVLARSKYNKVLDVNMSLNVSIPDMVPFFTYKEMNNMGINLENCNYTNYYSKVKIALESGDKDVILSLGWNPSLELTKESISLAYKRQIRWFEENFINVNDISNSDKKENISSKSELKPIFIILENPYPNNNDVKTYNIMNKELLFNRIGVSFDSNLNEIYLLKSSDGEFKGFTLGSLKDFSNFEVILYFIDSNQLDLIKEVVLRDNIPSNISTNSIFKYIYDSSYATDRTTEKLIYAGVIDLLLRLANIKNGNFKGFYRLFRGIKDTFNLDKIKTILDNFSIKYTEVKVDESKIEDKLDLINI